MSDKLRTVNGTELDDAGNEEWQQYLEILRERRGEKWYELAVKEGPPTFSEGMTVTVHGFEAHMEFRVSHINERAAKFILRPHGDENPVARYRAGETVLCKGVEFIVKDVKRGKLLMTPMPPQQEKPRDLYQAELANGATGRPFLVLVGETQDEVRANAALLDRVFGVVRTLGVDNKINLDELTVEANELVQALGLDVEVSDDQGTNETDEPGRDSNDADDDDGELEAPENAAQH